MTRAMTVSAMLVAAVVFMFANTLSAANDGTGTTLPTSTSPLTPEDAAAPAALQLPEQQKEEPVTIDVIDTDLAVVVKMFTRLQGVNIVTGTNISGTVTARLQNVPWKTALDSILKEKGLRLEDSEKSGVFNIVPRTGDDPLVTETIFLKFAEVPSVINVLKNALNPKGKIADFSSRNAMVIQSTQRNLSEIRAIVDQIDIPRRQVFVEAQFVELTSASGSDIGVGWDKMLKAYAIGGSAQPLNRTETITPNATKPDTLTKKDNPTLVDTFLGTYNVSGSTLTPGAAGAVGGAATASTLPTRTVTDTINKNVLANSVVDRLSGTAYTDVRTAVLNPLQLSLVLSALKSNGGTTVLSKPKIIVANGEQAMIHIGEERHPFIATVSPATQTTAPFTTYNPGPAIELGVKIVVTPTINTGSNITVIIEPELTRMTGTDTAPDAKTSYPITSTKKIKTQFTLANCRTAAIGGLTETTNTKDSNKVPVLSDLPLIGKYLFSHESDSHEQKEMIIFVTVGIVSPEAADENTGVPADSELIRKYKLDSKVASEAFQSELERQQSDTEKRTEKAEKRKRLILNRIR